MNTLKNDELKTYEQLLKLDQPRMINVMGQYLENMYGKENVVRKEEFVVAQGTIPICLCAHADTVFAVPPDELFYDRKKNVLWAPWGAGHDDRAGIYAIVRILTEGYRPHIIISTDEEVGCVGARELSQYKCPFKNLKYIIQLDRMGVNDCVFYHNDNKKFIHYVESFGFKEAKGSFTDIVQYCPAWNISGVNLSIGYLYEHTYSEILYVDAFLKTIEKVKNMLNNPPKKKFDYVPAPTYYQPTATKIKKAKKNGTCSCDKCGKSFAFEELYPVWGIGGVDKDFCIDCMMDDVNWCLICNEAFETTDVTREICDRCYEACKGDDEGYGC